ncbi:MAG: hypothetical protein AB1861_14700 [Cyanobacteriota bacterium]
MDEGGAARKLDWVTNLGCVGWVRDFNPALVRLVGLGLRSNQPTIFKGFQEFFSVNQARKLNLHALLERSAIWDKQREYKAKSLQS